MAGQTINDRLLAARHSLAGQGLAKSVCKATTEEIIGPKKKHLDYLVHCTNEPNVSIPQLANLLIERTQNTNWVVVYKALITVHHLLCYGNERFTQYLASSNSTFQLSSFLDKSGVQAGVGARVGYDMSPFIRRYAKYLNEKALSYRTVAFDFCKVKRGKEDGTLRTMNAEKLLKTLPSLQAQVDALLEFDCTANDLTNGVINMCFMLLFRDLIRLFACYNDGIINLLEKYFDMNKKQCRDALDLYKKFLIRMDRVGEFLKVAENVGIDKGDIPDLTKAPSSLLDALEQHLAVLEGKKGSAANTPTQSQSNRTNVKTGVSALSCTSSAFGTAATANGIDDTLRQQALAEEEAAMRQYNAKVQSPVNSGTNPFLAGSAPQSIVDLFGGGGGNGGISSGGGGGGGSNVNVGANAVSGSKASDDLLQLGNPFADIFGGGPPASGATATPAPALPPTPANWGTNGFGAVPAHAPQTFVTDNAFNSIFGGGDSNAAAGVPNPFITDPVAAGTDLFGGNDFFATATSASTGGPPPRPPPPASGPNSPPSSSSPAKSALDDLNDSIRMALGGSPTPAMQPPPATTVPQGFPAFGAAAPVGVPGGPPFSPARQGMAAAPAATNKVLTGDLDSSLASLAENLTMNKGGQPPAKGVQWNSPKSSAKPGGTGWSPQPLAATTGANYRPMGPGLNLFPPSPARLSYYPPSPVIYGMAPAGPRPGAPMATQGPAAAPSQMDPFGALM